MCGYTGIPRPQLVSTEQVDGNSIRVSWNADSFVYDATGFMIFLTDMNCTPATTNLNNCRSEFTMSTGEREYVLHGLVVGKNYQIEMVTLSNQLPSEPTSPQHVILHQGT